MTRSDDIDMWETRVIRNASLGRFWRSLRAEGIMTHLYVFLVGQETGEAVAVPPRGVWIGWRGRVFHRREGTPFAAVCGLVREEENHG